MERAAGNPLFLRELASVGRTSTEDAEDLPDTVETLVATRIDQLAPGDRALLRWASVLGVSFSGAFIIDVLEDDPTVAAASEAWDRLGEFVERDPDVPGAFRFRHALIRDAAYEGLSFRTAARAACPRRRSPRGAHARTLSSCSRSTTTAPRTSLRRGAGRWRRARVRRTNGPTSRRPNSTSARSRSPTTFPSSEVPRSRRHGKRSATAAS